MTFNLIQFIIQLLRNKGWEARCMMMGRLLILVAMWLPLVLHAETPVIQTTQFNRLSLDSLLSLADRYYQSRAVDTALVCYSLVALKGAEGDRHEKELAIEGYLGTFKIYDLHYCNYPKAFESLILAQEICKKLGIEKSRIYFDFGMIYDSIRERKDADMHKETVDYFRKAFFAAYDEGDIDVLEYAFANLLNLQVDQDTIEDLKQEWELYKQKDALLIDALKQFNGLFYHQLCDIREGNLTEALHQNDLQIELLNNKIKEIRFWLTTYTLRSRIFFEMKQPDKATSCLRNLYEQRIKSDESKDVKMECFYTLSEYYQRAGDKAEAQRFHTMYLEMKDSLLNSSQMKSIGELQFLEEINQLTNTIKRAEQQRKVFTGYAIATFVVLLALGLFSFLIAKTNRRLRRQTEALYNKNQELIEQQNRNKLQRKELEHQLIEVDTPEEKKQERQNGDNTKYRNSNLSEDDKTVIEAKILNVMENSHEIFSPDFSIDNLANMIGSKRWHVSQVINERYQCNFNTFLNRYRIMEACRQLSDIANYGHLTIEAIANGVGLKSRSAFTVAFKRITGLTPSEYQNVARSRERNNRSDS